MKNWCKRQSSIKPSSLVRAYGFAFIISLVAPTLASAHSAMFPDNFKYDDSNEGLKTSSKALVGKQSVRVVRPCVDGLAGDYPCRNIDMQAMMSVADLGGNASQLNDIWGWTDLLTGNEIAIVGRTNGTSFVDITDSTAPVLLGFLPSHGGGDDAWRDIKVFQDHAFIVADGRNNSSHGLQVFDLTQLANVTPGATLTETAHLGGFGSAHNIAINEDTGFAYVTGGDAQCSGGLYMIDISSPLNPAFAGCFSADGYTHDVQCVIYQGPDTARFGREICTAYNEDTVTIVDVTDKTNPQQLSRTNYPGVRYTHQGWFMDENHTYLLLNDELDETGTNVNTTTHIFDVSSLVAPTVLGRYVGPTTAIDHNLYTNNGLVYESNYRAGLRILDGAGVASATLEERAFFDTIPCSNSPQFSGVWSSYIYFASGNIVVSDIATGLFVLRPNDADIASNANDTPVAISPACATTTQPPPAPTDPPPADPTQGQPDNIASQSGGGGGLASIWMLVMGLLMTFGRHRFHLLVVANHQ